MQVMHFFNLVHTFFHIPNHSNALQAAQRCCDALLFTLGMCCKGHAILSHMCLQALCLIQFSLKSLLIIYIQSRTVQYIHGYSLIKSFLQCFINSTRFSSSQCIASVQTLKYSHDKLRVQTATQRTASERMKPKLISIQSCKIINWFIWHACDVVRHLGCLEVTSLQFIQLLRSESHL